MGYTESLAAPTPCGKPFQGPMIAASAALGPIFRVRPRDKRPLNKGWQGEATADPDAIAALWRQERDANIGLLCGVKCWVLDVDGPEGLATLADLEDLHRWLPIGPASVTGSGGQHLFFRADERVRNSVRRLGPGLDTRGAGGFVVLPPSIHPNGNRYHWLPGRAPWTVELPAAPPWLLDLLDPPRPAYRAPPRRQGATTPYVAAALAAELDAVSSAASGSRNAVLNRAAYSIGRFVASGDLLATDAGELLLGAALAAGLNEREANNTIKSGLRAVAARSA